MCFSLNAYVCTYPEACKRTMQSHYSLTTRLFYVFMAATNHLIS